MLTKVKIMASKEAENIVKRLMPGCEIVPQPRRSDAVDAMEGIPEERPSGGPSVADIRKKYAATSDSVGAAAYRPPLTDSTEVDEDDIEVVNVTPPGVRPDQGGPQVRTVIVSKKQKKIIGKQG